MKKKILVVLGLVAMLVQGCIVKSLHPFFAEEDVVFKPELIDAWTDNDGNRWKISPVKEKPNAYEMTASKDGKDGVFLVHLFKLDNNLYLDFLPISSDAESVAIFDLHIMPTHSVAKVETIERDRVSIKWFKEEWLADLFGKNRVMLGHETILDPIKADEGDKTYILTASTSELRKFLRKYGNDDAAFEGDNAVKLTLTRIHP